jgi:hypothetical protein
MDCRASSRKRGEARRQGDRNGALNVSVRVEPVETLRSEDMRRARLQRRIAMQSELAAGGMEVLDLVQTITAVAALIAAVVSFAFERREMTKSAKLNAAATLFAYYNAKIASLRTSIVRDTGSTERAQLESLEVRERRLNALLEKHAALLGDLENQYGAL